VPLILMRVFGANFLGVTGIAIEFQFGTKWAPSQMVVGMIGQAHVR
jgi:cytochrome bd-type quinol oxidase subunit 1